MLLVVREGIRLKPLLILLLVVLVVVYFWLRQRQAGAPQQQAPERRSLEHTRSEYHAVSIRFDTNACAAAQALDGRRFLSAAAPRLPLTECDVPECNCRFMHHADRRGKDDRRSPFSPGGMSSASGRYEQERREGRERRHDPDDIDFY